MRFRFKLIIAAPMERAQLLRVIDKQKVCVILRGSGAIIQAELATPLSPRSHVSGQMVNVLAAVPAMVSLGPYDTKRHMFTECHMDAELPEPKTSRVDYANRHNKLNKVA